MMTSQGVTEANRIADGIATRLNRYTKFRAVIEQHGLTFYSEDLTRAQVVDLLVNQPAGLKTVEGLTYRYDRVSGENEPVWEQV